MQIPLDEVEFFAAVPNPRGPAPWRWRVFKAKACVPPAFGVGRKRCDMREGGSVRGFSKLGFLLEEQHGWVDVRHVCYVICVG